jgi:hypothetical protein
MSPPFVAILVGGRRLGQWTRSILLWRRMKGEKRLAANAHYVECRALQRIFGKALAFNASLADLSHGCGTLRVRWIIGGCRSCQRFTSTGDRRDGGVGFAVGPMIASVLTVLIPA